MSDAAKQVDLLRKAAIQGNMIAVRSLLHWCVPTVSVHRQQSALAALSSLLSADSPALVNDVGQSLLSANAAQVLAPVINAGASAGSKKKKSGDSATPPSPSLADLAQGVLSRLPAAPGPLSPTAQAYGHRTSAGASGAAATGADGGGGSGSAAAATSAATNATSDKDGAAAAGDDAGAESDSVFVEDSVMDWAEDVGYDPDEIYDFKEEWDEHELSEGAGLSAEQYVAFIVQEFGSIEAGYAGLVAEGAPDHLLHGEEEEEGEPQAAAFNPQRRFHFFDFLLYMDEYESVSDSEGDDEEDGAQYEGASRRGESAQAQEDDAFYLGSSESEPHCSLRAFLVSGANHQQLTDDMTPSAEDFAAVFNSDVVETVRARLERVREARLAQPIRPVHAGQRVVGVYDIADEYRELWSQVGPMIREGVHIFGFDFNAGKRFSARGSATFAFLARSADGTGWRYFPARWIVMSEPEFVRRLRPELAEVQALANRIMKNDDVPGIGASLRPREEDWKALFPGNTDLATAAHALYEQSVAPGPDGQARAWNIGPVVALPYGVAAYYRYEVVSALAADFGDQASNFARRMTGRLPQTYRLIAPYVPQITLVGLTLTYGLMRAPDPQRPVAARYQNERYQYLEGDFAPNKTFSLLAKVNGRWCYFPRKILFAALGEPTTAETSNSEPEFWDSTDVEVSDASDYDDDYSDDYSGEDGTKMRPLGSGDVEGGAGRGVPGAEEEGWWCTIQ